MDFLPKTCRINQQAVLVGQLLRATKMLIEFSVSNFRSVRDRQTLSMVAAPKLHKRENTFKPYSKGEKLPSLLKIAAIYGPNASGKSTILGAFEVFRTLLVQTPSAIPDLLPVSPFRFDKTLSNEPSCFEYHVILDGLRYEIRLSLTQDRIHEETIICYPRGKESLIYSRKLVEGKDIYSYGESLDGGIDLHKVWSRVTGPRTLFLAQAVANSSEEIPLLNEVFSWFTRQAFVIDSSTMGGWAVASKTLIKNQPQLASSVTDFLSSVDIPISSIRFDLIDESFGTPEDKFKTHEDFSNAFNQIEKSHKTVFTHKTALGESEFDFSEESSGTKNLFGFWLPWSVTSQDDFTGKPLLLVDELDSSLHPQIVIALLQKHLQNEIPSQIIFSTHDTHILSKRILRRDQLWVTERDMNGATLLNSIHEFEGRDSDNVEKKYFEGRYRGLPVIRRN